MVSFRAEYCRCSLSAEWLADPTVLWAPWEVATSALSLEFALSLSHARFSFDLVGHGSGRQLDFCSYCCWLVAWSVIMARIYKLFGLSAIKNLFIDLI